MPSPLPNVGYGYEVKLVDVFVYAIDVMEEYGRNAKQALNSVDKQERAELDKFVDQIPVITKALREGFTVHKTPEENTLALAKFQQDCTKLTGDIDNYIDTVNAKEKSPEAKKGISFFMKCITAVKEAVKNVITAAKDCLSSAKKAISTFFKSSTKSESGEKLLQDAPKTRKLSN
jgi:hypothetical protein